MQKTLLILHNILHISEEGPPPRDFVQNLQDLEVGGGGGGAHGALTRTEPSFLLVGWLVDRSVFKSQKYFF